MWDRLLPFTLLIAILREWTLIVIHFGPGSRMQAGTHSETSSSGRQQAQLWAGRLSGDARVYSSVELGLQAGLPLWLAMLAVADFTLDAGCLAGASSTSSATDSSSRQL